MTIWQMWGLTFLGLLLIVLLLGIIPVSVDKEEQEAWDEYEERMKARRERSSESDDYQ